LYAIDVFGGIKDAMVRARLGRALRGIIWFAGGCAAALLYYWFGFWCLAVPVTVGIATVAL
jgi:fatty acid desaturase